MSRATSDELPEAVAAGMDSGLGIDLLRRDGAAP